MELEMGYRAADFPLSTRLLVMEELKQIRASLVKQDSVMVFKNKVSEQFNKSNMVRQYD
jgi:hypothetical protein